MRIVIVKLMIFYPNNNLYMYVNYNMYVCSILCINSYVVRHSRSYCHCHHRL